MKPETAGKVKYGSWGLVCGAIIAMIIGFGWGGWTTAGTTQKMSDEAILKSPDRNLYRSVYDGT
jgi:hypothetical protein